MTAQPRTETDAVAPCPFCGEVHPPGPVGAPGGAFAGIELKTCPKIPDEHLYIDEPAREGKPRGALFNLRHYHDR